MIQRDWKIGLVVGLIVVIVVVIKFATDPRLSPEARMMHSNNVSDSRDITDMNASGAFEVFENNQQTNDIPSVMSLDTEPSIATVSESENKTISNDFTFNGHTSLDDLQVSSDISGEQEPLAMNIEPPVLEEQPQVNTENDISKEPEPVSFDYENAEPIKTERFHIVGKNQTLSDISRIYYGSASKWQKIVDANPDLIKDPNKIKVGMKLIIPR